MRILDRHVLKETALASGAATAAFVFVLVAGNVLKQIAEALATGRINAAQSLELVVLLFPGVIPYALPMGVLTGILIALGRMSSQQEITAMKASGLSLMRIARPALLLALSLAALAAWLNLEVAPRANDEYRRLLVGSVKENPSALIDIGELNRQFKGLVIRAGSRDGDILKDFWLWRVDERGKLVQAIQASEARIDRIDKPDGEVFLRVNLKNAKMESRASEGDSFSKPASFASAGDTTMEFPATELFNTTGNHETKIRWLTTRELFSAMGTGWRLGPNATLAEIEQSKMDARKQFMVHLASAFSIFSLALLAVPLAMRVGRSETFVNAAIALGISLSYYTLSSAAAWVKQPGFRPDILVWIPNLIVIAIAVRLIRGIERN